MDPVRGLLKISRATGADESLVVWGGGNSSVKGWATDYRGRKVRALYVKGSGSDMKSLERKHLAVLDLDALLELRKRPSMSDEDMVAYMAAAMLEAGPRGSIETLLHAFLPGKFVLHTHADATAALTDNPRSKYHVAKAWKGRVSLVPYQRPGFLLSKAVWECFGRGAAGAGLKGIMLDKHGLITWGESEAEAYQATQLLVRQAAAYVKARSRKPARRAATKLDWNGALPVLRGALSATERQILLLDRSAEALAFSLRPDAPRLCAGGPATPDHLLYTKPRALYIAQPAGITKGVSHFRHWYEAYFKRHAPKKSIPLDPSPRVIVLKGFGVVSAGRDARSALIGRDIFRHSMRVRLGATGLGGYQAVSIQHIADFEYWPLENYKLSLAGPEKEFSRQIAVVTGAARGIGKACALRLAAAGALVAVVDLDLKAARAAAAQIGSGAVAFRCDISEESQVRKLFASVVALWGGLDILVSNAGLARCAPVMDSSVSDWDASFAVNARGHYLCSREAARIFRSQGIGGNMVFVSSKNVLAPGKDFAAYSASKAAQTQLAKVLAIELAGIQVRVNAVTPDGVFDDSRLWDAIRDSRAKAHGISGPDLEDFYVQRNLLKRKVKPADVAEAVAYLASERASKTTGSLIPVDGGVKEAFPR